MVLIMHKFTAEPAQLRVHYDTCPVAGSRVTAAQYAAKEVCAHAAKDNGTYNVRHATSLLPRARLRSRTDRLYSLRGAAGGPAGEDAGLSEADPGSAHRGNRDHAGIYQITYQELPTRNLDFFLLIFYRLIQSSIIFCHFSLLIRIQLCFLYRNI